MLVRDTQGLGLFIRYVLELLPQPIAATIGFNLTRRYKDGSIAEGESMNVEDNIIAGDSSESLILSNYFLEPLVEGKTFKLNNVLFRRGTNQLLDSSYVELDNVVRMMNDNPDIHIELSGHTDNQGNARKNVLLSQDRIEAVKIYLVNKGIDKNRISGKGYGGSRPIASNRMEETRRLNRRVEFTVIKTD